MLLFLFREFFLFEFEVMSRRPASSNQHREGVDVIGMGTGEGAAAAGREDGARLGSREERKKIDRLTRRILIPDQCFLT